jgi:hypothetical protein
VNDVMKAVKGVRSQQLSGNLSNAGGSSSIYLSADSKRRRSTVEEGVGTKGVRREASAARHQLSQSFSDRLAIKLNHRSVFRLGMCCFRPIHVIRLIGNCLFQSPHQPHLPGNDVKPLEGGCC